MRRIILFLVAILAMVAILALPAMAYHNGYSHDYDDPYETYGHDDDDDGRYDDRYPPGFRDSGEPREPDCDWYGPYEERPWDPWWEYWCYWHGWGWEFVFWVYD